MKLTPVLRRFLIAIGENRWGTEPGNRIAAAQRLKKLGLVRWVFTPYGPGAYSGTNRPELTPEGEDVVKQLTLKENHNYTKQELSTLWKSLSSKQREAIIRGMEHKSITDDWRTAEALERKNLASVSGGTIKGETYASPFGTRVRKSSRALPTVRLTPLGRTLGEWAKNKQVNPSLESDLVPILEEVARKGRVKFHQKHYPLLHAGLVEYASTQRRRFAYVQITDAGMEMDQRLSNPLEQEEHTLRAKALADVTNYVTRRAFKRKPGRLNRMFLKDAIAAADIGVKDFEVYKSSGEWLEQHGFVTLQPNPKRTSGRGGSSGVTYLATPTSYLTNLVKQAKKELNLEGVSLDVYLSSGRQMNIGKLKRELLR